ncbi:MAG: protein kinase [Gammaproteobacteria bacterium]|nr:protein kinase [Gammaproteobacteria bacterium]
MQEYQKGQQLSGRFTLVSRLGQGGMGEVWLARDDHLARDVALKILSPELAANPAMVELLQNECRLTRQMVHPNIVRVHEFHSDGDSHFISMEYVEGDNLEALAGRHHEVWLPVLLPVLDALEYAHEAGMVHRDIKLSNVLYTADGEVRLNDFGIGGIIGKQSDAFPGGSPYSASPQQLDGQPGSIGDDIYAVGAMLYALMSGKPPFYADPDKKKIAGQVPPPPKTDYPPPDGLVELVMRILARDPRDRPDSIGEVRELLADITGVSSTSTRPPGELVGTGVGNDKIVAIRRQHNVPGRERPGSGQDDPAGRSWLSGLAMALLLLVAAVVFLYLPSQVAKREPVSGVQIQWPTDEIAEEQPPAAVANTQSPADTRLAPYEQAQATRDREEAEGLVARLLRRQIALEDQAVHMWAADEFNAAVELVRSADSLFRKDEYASALDAYQSALDEIDRLSGQVDGVLNAALEAGGQALLDGDPETAQRNFELAAAIDPDNPVAIQGLRRSATVEQVLALMVVAEAKAADGDLPGAKKSYQELLAIDADWQPAKTALGQLNRDLAKQNYSRQMSAGFANLAENRLLKAREAFRSALRMRPGSEDAKDGLFQVEAAIKLAEISRLRGQAEAYAVVEQWPLALNDYQSALKLDPNLVFARDGEAHAQKMIRIDKEFALYVVQPERLGEDNVYQAALGFLEQARLLADPGPRLQAQLLQLQVQLQVSRIPVRVDLVSDQMTEVFINRIGRIGTFAEHVVRLVPGKYTLIGIRDGYRDVRRQLVVLPGISPEPVLISCEEKI